MAQKRVIYIPEGSNPLQEKFINCIMKQGKNTVARRIFADTLKIIADKGNKNPQEVFEKAIEKAKPQMEVRPKRIGGAVYQIPVEVKPSRQIMLAIRWILEGARAKSGTSMAARLSNELLDVVNDTGNAIKKKSDVERMAQANKAFAHFARY